MTSIVPHRFLFRFQFAAPRVAGLPRRQQSAPLDLPPSCQIIDPGGLDDAPAFADVRVAWNENGIGFQVEVRGKHAPPRCHVEQLLTADGLHLWLDTRGTRNIHRASRFCHRFCFMPCGGRNGTQPVGVQLPVPRAKEDAPLSSPRDLLVASEIFADGYGLQAWLPAAVLNGFDPQAQPHWGFCYVVRDSELGEQGLAVGDDFPYESDPSLWSVLALTET